MFIAAVTGVDTLSNDRHECRGTIGKIHKIVKFFTTSQISPKCAERSTAIQPDVGAL
jgi:hypothetical protein